MIEKNLVTQASRADKAEKRNAQLQAELQTSKELLAHYQAAAAMGASPNDVSWHAIKEKSSLAMQILQKTAHEAKTGIDLLLRNAHVFNQVAQLLKDVDRAATLADH
jgi:hypothetical protein